MRTFFVAAAIGFLAYFAGGAFRAFLHLGSLAGATEAEGVAAVTVSWGRLILHSLVSGVVVGVLAVLVAWLRPQR